MEKCCGDGTKLCGIPPGNVGLFDFVVHLQQQIFVLKLLKDVCSEASDFADRNCIGYQLTDNIA